MFDYPLSKQDVFVSNLDRLREVAPEVATAFVASGSPQTLQAPSTPSSAS